MHFDNKYALIEVKLGANEIPEAEEYLLKSKKFNKRKSTKNGSTTIYDGNYGNRNSL